MLNVIYYLSKIQVGFLLTYCFPNFRKIDYNLGYNHLLSKIQSEVLFT